MDGVADARLGPDRPVRRLSGPDARIPEPLGAVVDIWTVASLGSGMAPGAVLAVFATGLLFSIPHMAGNFVFILLLYRPIAKKLDRVGRKYGILLQKY